MELYSFQEKMPIGSLTSKPPICHAREIQCPIASEASEAKGTPHRRWWTCALSVCEIDTFLLGLWWSGSADWKRRAVLMHV